MSMTDNIFYGTRGPRSAKIMFVGEAWGANEAREELPFVGNTGKELDRLCTEAGIPINQIFYTNVVSARPHNNDMTQFLHHNNDAKTFKLKPYKELFPKDIILNGINTLKKQIELVNPELIVGFGNWASWALTDKAWRLDKTTRAGYRMPSGIGSWRGSQIYTCEEMGKKKFMPTYHPAATFQTYSWRYMIRHDLRARVPLAFKEGGWDEDPRIMFHVRPNFDETTSFLQDILCRLDAAPTRVTLDLETRDGFIACCGIGLNKFIALCIPFMCYGFETGYWPKVEEVEIVLLLRKILLHPNVRLEGQNLLFDVQYIAAYWLVVPKIFRDSMVMHHVCWPGGGDPNDIKSKKAVSQGIQKKSLANIASLYCDHYYFWKDEGKIVDTSVPEDQNWIYNCRDIIKTNESVEELEKLVEAFGLKEQMEFQHLVMNEMLLPMMITGVKRDLEQKKIDEKMLVDALARFDRHLQNLMPAHLIPPGNKGSKPWYQSPQKLKTILYDILGISPVYDKKKGTMTTGKEALPIIAKREPLLRPVLDKIELRRSVAQRINNFIKMREDADGRLRCAYNVAGTDTFRLSSGQNVFENGGNLQNISSGKELGEEVELPADLEQFKFPNLRNEFVPDIGYECAEFDLSGADAQVVAWEAKDEDLKAAFRAGLKLHIKNARDVFPEITRNMSDDDLKATDHAGGIYHKNKRLVHGTNYGGAPSGLSERIVGVSVAEAEEFQERWFYLHPGIRGWHQRTERMLQGLQCWNCDRICSGEQRCPACGRDIGRIIGNRFGYRIFYSDRMNELYTKALAWCPQSTVAINTYKGALNLRREVSWVELLLQVHDSLFVQYPIRYSDRLGDIKQALHRVVVPYKDPLTIPWGVKVSRKSWGEAEQIKW